MSCLRSILAAACLTLGIALPTQLLAAEPGLYEMRVYYTNEGKLDALHARFRDHTMAALRKARHDQRGLLRADWRQS